MELILRDLSEDEYAFAMKCMMAGKAGRRRFTRRWLQTYSESIFDNRYWLEPIIIGAEPDSEVFAFTPEQPLGWFEGGPQVDAVDDLTDEREWAEPTSTTGIFEDLYCWVYAAWHRWRAKDWSVALAALLFGVGLWSTGNATETGRHYLESVGGNAGFMTGLLLVSSPAICFLTAGMVLLPGTIRDWDDWWGRRGGR